MRTIEAVYRERFASFVRLAWAITRNEQQAYDVVHDGFVRAVRHRRALRRHESAGAWIARIVLNEARRRVGDAQDATVDPDDVVSLDGHRDGGALEAAIAALPERQRLVLFLHYYVDLDYREIASALDISPADRRPWRLAGGAQEERPTTMASRMGGGRRPDRDSRRGGGGRRPAPRGRG
jgi:RNA polymerase sigma-70 factor (ECF subfamily)